MGDGVVQVAGVRQRLSLLRQRGVPPVIAVAQRVHGNACSKVRVLLAVQVIHLGALAVGQDDGCPAICLQNVLLLICDDLLGAWGGGAADLQGAPPGTDPGSG